MLGVMVFRERLIPSAFVGMGLLVSGLILLSFDVPANTRSITERVAQER
jgi:hypothetical protein